MEKVHWKALRAMAPVTLRGVEECGQGRDFN